MNVRLIYSNEQGLSALYQKQVTRIIANDSSICFIDADEEITSIQLVQIGSLSIED